MKLFGKIVQLTVNVAALPVEAVKDVFTLGGSQNYFGHRQSYTSKRIEKLVEDAKED